MAATNVQAFSGDVTISSNLVVDTNTLFVDSVGNKVGIGTTSPATPFHINKLTATTGPLAHTTTEFIRIRGDKVNGSTYAISGGIKLGGDTGGTATADGRIEFYANDGAGVSNDYGDIPDNLIMCMRGDGNVGIGTTAPGEELSVIGKCSVQNDGTYIPRFMLKSGANNTNGWRMMANVSDSYAGGFTIDRENASTPSKFMILNSGNVGIGTATPLAGLDVRSGDGTESDTHATFGKAVYASTGWSGIRLGTPHAAAHDAYCSVIESYNAHSSNYNSILRFKTSSGNNAVATERMRIEDDGKVGIGGVAGPTATLEVYNDATAANAAGLVADFTGPWIRIGDARTARTFSSGTGIKFHDSGIANFSIGIKDSVLKIGQSSSDGNTLFPGAGTDKENTLCITTAGNVGIGTTDPTTALEISRTFTANDDTSAMISFQNPQTGYHEWRIGPTIFAGTAAFSIKGGADGFGNLSDVIAIKDTSVGIGTNNPGENLHIYHPTHEIHRSVYWSELPASGSAKVKMGYLGSSNPSYASGGLGLFKNSYEGSTEDETVRIQANGVSWFSGGNVGIGTVTPNNTLHVEGTIRSTSTISCNLINPNEYGRNRDFRDITFSPSYIGNGRFKVGFADFGGYVDVLGLNTYTDSSGGGANALMFYKQSILARQYQLTSTSTSAFSTNYKTFDMTAPSDDRLKDNEEYIRNATDTLMKLKPQIYDLKLTLTSDVYERAAGVIVQDVWYDTPELRFLVKPGYLSQIPKEAPKRSDDPRDDPDYSKWGEEHAELDYDFFIPYIIKSIQEVVTELPRSKTQVSDIIPSNVDYYRGMLVSADTNEFKNNVPKLSLTKQSLDKKCYGVVSSSNTYSIDNEILIDTKGPGKVWVINHSNIESGDYLTSSNVHGYAMKQEDDVLHNYTVAKTTMDCDFNTRDIIIKRVKQELKDVTYYVKETLSEITKEKYDTIEDVYYKKSQERSIYVKTEYESVDETAIYDKLEYSSINDGTVVSVDEWNVLESNVQSTYTPRYLKEEIKKILTEEYSTLDETEKSEYESTTEIVYYHKYPQDSKNPLPEYTIEEVRQEYVNVLDEHGQIQWEDTDKTETAYNIRYLDANGVITDEANTVHRAAFVGCTYHCG